MSEPYPTWEQAFLSLLALAPIVPWRCMTVSSWRFQAGVRELSLAFGTPVQCAVSSFRFTACGPTSDKAHIDVGVTFLNANMWRKKGQNTHRSVKPAITLATRVSEIEFVHSITDSASWIKLSEPTTLIFVDCFGSWLAQQSIYFTFPMPSYFSMNHVDQSSVYQARQRISKNAVFGAYNFDAHTFVDQAICLKRLRTNSALSCSKKIESCRLQAQKRQCFRLSPSDIYS